MVTNADLMASIDKLLAEIPAIMRRELDLHKYQNPTPDEFTYRKKMELLDKLNKATGPWPPWRRAGKIVEWLKGTAAPPDGLQGVVKDWNDRGFTQTQWRIRDLLIGE